MGSCSVSVTPKNIFIFTVHKTSDWLGVLAPPFFKADRASTPTEFGLLILEALGSSQSNYDISNRSPKEILEFTGYRSFRTFARDSIVIQVRDDGKKVILTPTDPGPNGGVLHDPDHSISCAFDGAEIGKVFFQMLEEKEEQHTVIRDKI